MFCRKCGQEILDEAAICIHCGCSTQANTIENGDAPSTGMAVLGFFIPLAGFIIWIMHLDTKPLLAKSAGKGALAGIITCGILTALLVIFYFVFIFALIGGMMYY